MTELVLDDGQKINLNGAESINSREAIAMYSLHGRIYKIYNSERQAKLSADYNAAVAHEVPVVTAKIYHCVYVHDNRRRNACCIEMEHMWSVHTAYVLHDSGKPAELSNSINNHDNSKVAARRAIQLALSAGITDPQLFYEPVQGMPVRFFDIHVQNNHRDANLEYVIEHTQRC